MAGKLVIVLLPAAFLLTAILLGCVEPGDRGFGTVHKLNILTGLMCGLLVLVLLVGVAFG